MVIGFGSFFSVSAGKLVFCFLLKTGEAGAGGCLDFDEMGDPVLLLYMLGS